MTKCLIGSQKQVSAPETFKVNTGAICFLLNIDSPICELLDKIPSLVGEGWKEILKEVAGSAFTFVTSDDVDTAAFCAVNPPPLPPDITYIEVFQLIASYVPPLSLVASSSPILKKISDYYLFTKWQEFCECKKEEEEEDDDDDDDDGYRQKKSRLPRLELDDGTSGSAACPSNSDRTIANNILADIEDIGRRAKAEANEDNALQRSLVSRSIFEQRIQDFIDNYGGSVPIDNNYNINTNSETEPSQTGEENFSRGAGCINLELRQINGFSFDIEAYDVELFNIEGASVTTLSTVRIYRRAVRFVLDNVDISQCNCDEEKPPKVPKRKTQEEEEECDCIPIAPKRFCELFPSDPLCANVPDKEEECGEPTEIEVEAYDDCEPSTKIVYWRIE